MADYYPPLGFHFQVFFNEAQSSQAPDGAFWGFQSVSGLSSEVVTETFKEGGQRFDYELPVKTQYPDLVLKRGLYIPGKARDDNGPRELLYWCQEMMETLKVKPSTIYIDLLNPSGALLMTWKILGAWPKKWNISDFNAEENQLVIETMEFHYDYFTIEYVHEGYAKNSVNSDQ